MTGLASLGAPTKRVLPLKDELTPLALGSRSAMNAFVIAWECIAADNILKDLHPSLLVLRVVGVKVDDLAIVEANTETLLNKHVAFFFLSKCGSATLAAFACRLLFSQSPTVVNKSLCICEIDGGAWLSCSLVISSQLGADKLEVTATPVL